jgi:hypothetical protein
MVTPLNIIIMAEFDAFSNLHIGAVIATYTQLFYETIEQHFPRLVLQLHRLWGSILLSWCCKV